MNSTGSRVGRVFSLVCVLFTAGCGTAVVKDARHPGSFSFGIISDVQYADKATAGTRHYQASLGKLKQCVRELNKHDLAFTIQLGDIIDGQDSPEKTLADLDRVLKVHSKLNMPWYHVVGNHCLTAGHDTLHDKLKLTSFYYSFTPSSARGWRFMVLDGNDAGYGVLGAEQLNWLEEQLRQARANSDKVIIFNHFALIKAAAKNHRMKTPEPVLKLIREYGCVAACFAGHDHAGGYAFDDGVHHVTFKGMVEGASDIPYAIIEVHPEKLNEVGYGTEPSREMSLAPTQPR